jgi:hypothetical protein
MTWKAKFGLCTSERGIMLGIVYENSLSSRAALSRWQIFTYMYGAAAPEMKKLTCITSAWGPLPVHANPPQAGKTTVVPGVFGRETTRPPVGTCRGAWTHVTIDRV